MTSSDGECGAVSCATVALVCPYVRCVCWFAAAAIADISTDSRYQLGHWSLRVRLGGEMHTAGASQYHGSNMQRAVWERDYRIPSKLPDSKK